jgi:murein L,D-transpeptidase YafK
MLFRTRRFALLAAFGVLSALSLTACQDDPRFSSTRHLTPLPPKLVAQMEEKGMSKSDPILIRSFKKESEIEVWKRTKSGEYALLKSYPICRWSGQLGPKVREGDRQAPEGFYAINPAQMNPNSSYYLSFDTGYPNAYDRANGYTGSYLMVHGACSSRGCFSMTDEQIAEIYALGREAFAGGQRSFQFQSFPFRMTAENMARHRNDPNMAFWKMLKEGSDVFEVSKREPVVGVCGKRYAFGAQGSEAGSLCSGPRQDGVYELIAKKQRDDNAKIAELISSGTPAVRLVYEDGGQHPSFRATSYASSGERELVQPQPVRAALADVSRPEALERGPQEIEVDTGGKPKPAPKPAAAPPAAAPAAVALAPLTPRPGATSNGIAPAIAPAQQAATVTPVATDDQPFYKKVLSLGGLFSSGGDKEAVPANEPATPQPANVPLPPRRQAATQTAPIATPVPKPQAAAPGERRVELRGALDGSALTR